MHKSHVVPPGALTTHQEAVVERLQDLEIRLAAMHRVLIVLAGRLGIDRNELEDISYPPRHEYQH
jgi:hypothetical protein